ncbi:MAG: twitching motility protein PilT [Acidobacteriota bacterium]|nr:twitching motility protein PilT [Acidobacteriota bacterium]
MSDLLRDPELDQLIGDLNRKAEGVALGSPFEPAGDRPEEDPAAFDLLTAPPARVPERRLVEVAEGEPLARLLHEMTRRGASDLLLLTGLSPVLRLDGRLVVTDLDPLEEEELRQMLSPYQGARAHRQLEEEGSADFSLRLGGLGGSGTSGGWRFRVNLHRQRGRLAAALRALPREIPTLQKLNLPKSLGRLVQQAHGLVLVCGPTGSGKSSTLAALVGEINQSRSAHIITIEDPVEYEHTNGRSIIEQVEIGLDAPSFAAALRAALRQDPDVILVGEMRDLETVATALTAAETGHLILSTLHTSDVVQAIHRIVDVFPPGHQSQIRQQLALSLHAIVFQQLLPRADGAGRIPALELLLGTYPVRHHIRTQHLQKLYNEITLGKNQGMFSFEDSLATLVKEGKVNAEEARMRSTRPDELESLMR